MDLCEFPADPVTHADDGLVYAHCLRLIRTTIVIIFVLVWILHNLRYLHKRGSDIWLARSLVLRKSV